MSSSNWKDSLWLSFKSETATWFAGAVIAAIAALLPQITESVKLNLNRADYRSQQYESLASDISEYIFYSELFVEFLENDLTEKEVLDQIIADYNRAIVAIRKKEFVYIARLNRAWGKSDADSFNQFLGSIKQFDAALRDLNPDIVGVRKGRSLSIDPGVTKRALVKIKPAVEKVRSEGRRMLINLESG